MTNKLEPGMYVRTNDGFIAKFIKKKKGSGYRVYDNCKKPVIEYYFDKPIWDTRYVDGYYDDCMLEEYEIEELTTEPSFDITDVIKPGDYVNGVEIEYADHGFVTDCEGRAITRDHIKTILTKEQFEMMVYKVGEKVS